MNWRNLAGPVPAALPLFVLVEALAEALRRHLDRGAHGLWAAPALAALACALWSFTAHRRLAFRGAGEAAPGLAGLAPFLAAAFAAAILQAAARGAGEGAADLAWALGVVARYAFARRFTWPAPRCSARVA